MIANKRISITANTNIGENEIATYGAVIHAETNDISFYTRYVDKDACKDNRDMVRKDQAEFEDFAYSIQESLKDK